MSIKISGFQLGAATGIPQYGTVPAYYLAGIGTSDSGLGLAQVSFNAPANGTAISFITSDRYSDSNTDGYMRASDGWSTAVDALNGGGNWWEYVWVSTKSFGSIVTGEIATSEGFLSGNFVGVVEVLNGTTQSPNLSATYIGMDSSSSSISTGYDISNNDFAVLCIGVEGHDNPGGNVTSVVSTSGLTWTKKSSKSNIVTFFNDGISNLYQTCDIWYAKNDTGNDIFSDNVTVTFAGAYDDASLAITNFSNVNFASPWAS